VLKKFFEEWLECRSPPAAKYVYMVRSALIFRGADGSLAIFPISAHRKIAGETPALLNPRRFEDAASELCMIAVRRFM
jgi:hypothetical protein